MVSERPIRRKLCSHANNLESLIAFRNTYVCGGSGDGGRWGWGRFQWFSGCNMLTVIFFLFFFSLLVYPISLSISLSHHNQGKKKNNNKKKTTTKKKKKNACTRTPEFLKKRSPPPLPTNSNSFKSLNTSLSSRGGGGGGGAWPRTGYRCLNKRGDERPLNSVLQPWTLSDFFPLGPEKLTLFF